MNTSFLAWGISTELWVASAVMAIFASYVALNLIQSTLGSVTATGLRSQLLASLALATGIFATHFIAIGWTPLPIALGYSDLIVLGAVLLSFIGSAVTFRLTTAKKPSIARLAGAALILGCVNCAAPGLTLLALRMVPELEWQYLLLATAWLLASVLGALAWQVFTRLASRTDAKLSVVWRIAAATILGGSIASANAIVLMASSVPLTAWSITSDQVSLNTLIVLATIGGSALLMTLLLSSIIEARLEFTMQHINDQLKTVDAELKTSAQTDPLTRLPNRTMFEECLHRAVLNADEGVSRLALLFVNLDALKSVNETFGQEAGDSVLQEIAQRLQKMMRPTDMVARAGGDEFLVLVDGDPNVSYASDTANRVLELFKEPFKIGHREVSLGCSVGVAMYPEHGATSKLISHAAAAMHSAKQGGGSTYCFFESRMLTSKRDEMDLLRDLRQAIEKNQLELYYQPKIHAPSGEITGAEALMRWHHPTRGMIGPTIFIPMAERAGLVNALGNWLIEDACRQIRQWRDKGLRMRVAINLSVHQLRQSDLVERICGTLARYRINPGQLTCEITESVAMEDAVTTTKTIEQLQTAGVHLSIDDFGTGYSSLSYLRQMAAQEVKIDRSFVQDLEISADARAIVDAVVKLGQALGLKVVAEGVETVEQQEILRSLGCDELQGYLFAKPMSAEALALWAMNDQGPRALEFRSSLFGATMPAPMN